MTIRSHFFKPIVIIAATGFLYGACKKSDPGKVEIKYRKLKVMEASTNLPIANALVKFYSSTTTSFIDSTTTDAAGYFQFDENLDIHSITASHSNYWDGTTGGNYITFDDIHLQPADYTRVRLRKVQNHAADLLLVVAVDHYPCCGISGPATAVWSSQANDTTVLLKSYGNTDNFVWWLFTDQPYSLVAKEAGGETPGYFINRFDTTSLEINY